MDRSGSRHSDRFGEDEFAVFEEVTPAARGLIQEVVRVFEQAKKSVDDLTAVLAQAQERERAASKDASSSGRKGHGPLLYRNDEQQLLDDIDKILLELPAMDGVPDVQLVCDQLPGRDHLGMAKSTLRDKLIKLGVLNKEQTLKRYLVKRKEELDERRFGATRMFSHVAAAVIVMATCAGKIDPGNVSRLLLLD